MHYIQAELLQCLLKRALVCVRACMLAVGIHELGHFLAAVTRGIHVTKFSIGFGPTLFKWQASTVP